MAKAMKASARVAKGCALLVVATTAAACGVSHIAQYTPKHRDYKDPVKFSERDGQAHNGSLFSANRQGAYMFADQRAMRVGDIVTIRISEQANAKRGAATELSRDGSAGLHLDSFFELMRLAGAQPDLLKGSLATGFKGQGNTSRTEKLEATVPAVVRRRLPNGNLFIEGHRVVLVNAEEHHFYVSGVIRPVDIAGDNSVPSYLVADAEIEFTGRGVITEKQRPGWISRGLDYAAPF